TGAADRLGRGAVGRRGGRGGLRWCRGGCGGGGRARRRRGLAVGRRRLGRGCEGRRWGRGGGGRRAVVGEELLPARAHRRRVGEELLVHLVDEPFVRPDGRRGRGFLCHEVDPNGALQRGSGGGRARRRGDRVVGHTGYLPRRAHRHVERELAQG